MDVQSIMLREVSQIEKDKYCAFSLICGIQKIKQRNEGEKSGLIDLKNNLICKHIKRIGMGQCRERGLVGANYEV